jgi:hypothetical protein
LSMGILNNDRLVIDICKLELFGNFSFRTTSAKELYYEENLSQNEDARKNRNYSAASGG